jgi:hypothetical protein
VQPVLVVGQQEACGVHVEQVDAGRRESVQHVAEVELVVHRVREQGGGLHHPQLSGPVHGNAYPVLFSGTPLTAAVRYEDSPASITAGQ